MQTTHAQNTTHHTTCLRTHTNTHTHTHTHTAQHTTLSHTSALEAYLARVNLVEDLHENEHVEHHGVVLRVVRVVRVRLLTEAACGRIGRTDQRERARECTRERREREREGRRVEGREGGQEEEREREREREREKEVSLGINQTRSLAHDIPALSHCEQRPRPCALWRTMCVCVRARARSYTRFTMHMHTHILTCLGEEACQWRHRR